MRSTRRYFKKIKGKFKQEHPEVARYEKAADYLAKHPDDKDKTKNELQQEQETLLSEIAELKVPLTEVQEDLKKLRTSATGYGKPHPAQRKAKSRPRSSPSKKSCRIRLTRKKHKEPPRHRRNTDNRIWNFNRHLPFQLENVRCFSFFKEG